MTFSSEGRAPFKLGDETFETFYQIFGDLKDRSRRPLVLLHGGPGLDCTYLANFEYLWTEYRVPVVMYDQLGGGRSTHLPHKGSDFWTPDLFSDELQSLLVFLGVQDDYHLYGHSWGGMLAAYFVATRRPAGLGKVIISNSPISFKGFVEAQEFLLAKLPKDLQDEIWKHERREKYDEDLFQKGVAMFLDQFACRVQPSPLWDLLTELEKDPTVNNCMEGDLFFVTTGTLKDFTLAPYLPRIKEPVLLVNGEYDMCQDLCVKPCFDLLPKVKWVHLKDTSHIPFHEIRDKFMKIVYDFLTNQG